MTHSISSSLPPTTPKPQSYLHNYFALAGDGGFFIGGMAFLSAETVLPTMIAALGGATWMQGLMPSAMMIGFTCVPLLLAHIVEHLPSLKRYIIYLGLFQRAPFAIAALCLWFLGESHPVLCLTVAWATPFISGIFGGSLVGAFTELNRRVIPLKRMSSAVSLRFLIGSGIGLCAGQVVSTVLDTWPTAQAYAILHGITFLFLGLSYFCFLQVKEQNNTTNSTAKRTPLITNITNTFTATRSSSPKRLFTFQLIFGYAWFIILPFLPAYAQQSSGEPASFVGSLLSAYVFGMLIGNIFITCLGDRIGGRTTLLSGRLIQMGTCLGIIFVQQAYGFLIAYACMGFAFQLSVIGQNTVMMYVGGHHKAISWYSFSGMLGFPCLLLTSAASTYIEYLTADITPALILAFILLSISLICTYRIPKEKEQA